MKSNQEVNYDLTNDPLLKGYISARSKSPEMLLNEFLEGNIDSGKLLLSRMTFTTEVEKSNYSYERRTLPQEIILAIQKRSSELEAISHSKPDTLLVPTERQHIIYCLLSRYYSTQVDSEMISLKYDLLAKDFENSLIILTLSNIPDLKSRLDKCIASAKKNDEKNINVKLYFILNIFPLDIIHDRTNRCSEYIYFHAKNGCEDALIALISRDIYSLKPSFSCSALATYGRAILKFDKDNKRVRSLLNDLFYIDNSEMAFLYHKLVLELPGIDKEHPNVKAAIQDLSGLAIKNPDAFLKVSDMFDPWTEVKAILTDEAKEFLTNRKKNIIEIRKNARVIAQASRDKTTFFYHIPDEVLVKISSFTSNPEHHPQIEADKIANDYLGRPNIA